MSYELGHADGDMVEEVYARLGTIRHRSEVVEFRPAVATETLQRYGEEAQATAFQCQIEALQERAAAQVAAG